MFLAYDETKLAIMPVLVSSAFAVAYGCVAVPAGGWAEMVDRRLLVISSNVAKAVLYSGVLVLVLTGSLSVAVIIGASAIAGATTAAQYPSWQELLRSVFPKGKLDEANALFASLGSTANIVGALAGGIVLAMVGAAPLFAFNVASYLPYIWAVANIPAATVRTRRSAKRIPLPAVARFLEHTKAVRRAFLVMGLLSALALPLLSLLPRIANDIGSSPHWYGILAAAYYVGAASVAVLLGWLKEREAYSHTVRLATIAAGSAIAIVGAVGLASPGRIVLLFAFALSIALAGLSVTVASATLGALAQLGSAPSIEGSVLGVYGLVTMVATTIGGLVQGELGDTVAVSLVVLTAGALILIAGEVLHRFRAYMPLNEVAGLADPDHAHLIRHAHGARSVLFGGGPPTTGPLTAGTSEHHRERERDRLIELEHDADRVLGRAVEFVEREDRAVVDEMKHVTSEIEWSDPR